jgi:DNA-binding CsgD family transcriptional regulator
MLAHYQGDERVVAAMLDECEALSRDVRDDESLARALLLRGVAAEDAGRYPEAEPRLAEAVEIFRRLGHTLWMAQALVHQGVVAFGLGDLQEANERCEAGLAAYRRVGSKLGAAVGITAALDVLSFVALRRNDLAAARELQARALAMRVDLEDQRGIASSIGGIAVIAAAGKQSSQAAQLFGAADALRNTLGVMLAHPELDIYAELVEALRRELTAPGLDAAWQAGQAMRLDDVLELCRALVAEPSTDTPIAGEEPNAGIERLTAREREVLPLIAAGKSDKEIADALFISPRTAMRHVANVFAKLDVHSRAAAAAYARRHGPAE